MKKKTISCVFRSPEVTIEVDSKTPVKDYKHKLFTELYNQVTRSEGAGTVIDNFEDKCIMHLIYVSDPFEEELC